MKQRLSSELMHVICRVWHALLVINTVVLLSVAVYAAITSPADGPSATPLLMAGLLSLGVVILAAISAVNALLWGSATRASWFRRVGLVLLGFFGSVLVLQLAIYASDHNYPTTRRICLVLFPLSVLAAYVLNRRAVRQYRTQR